MFWSLELPKLKKFTVLEIITIQITHIERNPLVNLDIKEKLTVIKDASIIENQIAEYL